MSIYKWDYSYYSSLEDFMRIKSGFRFRIIRLVVIHLFLINEIVSWYLKAINYNKKHNLKYLHSYIMHVDVFIHQQLWLKDEISDLISAIQSSNLSSFD